jgi:AAA domain-containing protein/primase-like protein/Homeodomain-like domain-containing protein
MGDGMTPDEMRADMEDFLAVLFLNFGTRHAIELRALPSKDRTFAPDVEKAVKFAEAHASENVLVGVVTREGGGTKADCREITALWVDLDFGTAAEFAARERRATFPLKPSMKIESGGSQHWYWLLSQVADAHDGRIEPILRGLTRHLGGDIAAAEIARCLRLPGTLNHKYSPPRVCKILEVDSDVRYTLEDFEKYAEQPAARLEAPKTDDDDEGKIAEGGRHRHLVSLAGAMRARGATPAAIESALMAENAEHFNIPKEADEVRRIARDIGKKLPGAVKAAGPGREPLRVVDVHSFLNMEIAPRHMMLAPWLPYQSLSMIYARRGTGKTHLALGIAYAVAGGGEVLGWKAPEARKVLYIDGEMLAAPLQERLAAIIKGANFEPAPGMLNIVTPDLQPGLMPDLATPEGQAAVEEVTPDDTRLIVVDSISSLMRGAGRENDAEFWLPIQEWALSERVKGRAVIFLHHANRRGEQRGTSKKEDALDVVLVLRPPPGHEPHKGAKFEVHIEKSRALCADFTPIEAELIARDGGGVAWAWKTVKDTLAERIRRMAEDGVPKNDIAEELHVNRSTVWRILSRRKGETE